MFTLLNALLLVPAQLRSLKWLIGRPQTWPAVRVVRLIEQCCFNSTSDAFNGQTANFILKPPKVIESRKYVKKDNLECYWNNTVYHSGNMYNWSSLVGPKESYHVVRQWRIYLQETHHIKFPWKIDQINWGPHQSYCKLFNKSFYWNPATMGFMRVSIPCTWINILPNKNSKYLCLFQSLFLPVCFSVVYITFC